MLVDRSGFSTEARFAWVFTERSSITTTLRQQKRKAQLQCVQRWTKGRSIPKETLTTVSHLPHQLSLLMEWTFCPTSFPPVDFLTVIAHVAKTGKTCKTVPQLSEDDDGIFIAMRSLDRAREFFYRGYVEEVMVCRKENVVFVKSKCWASQKKSVQYRQVLQLYCPEDGGCRVQYATCRGCVAGTDGGLCSHVSAVLMVLDKCRKEPPTSVTSLPRSWGPRQRNIEPVPVSEIVVEKSTFERKGPPISFSLYEAWAPRLRDFDVGECTSVFVCISLSFSLSLSLSLSHSLLLCGVYVCACVSQWKKVPDTFHLGNRKQEYFWCSLTRIFFSDVFMNACPGQ